MKRPSLFTRRHGEVDIKMTPMIDVVFLLLVFFVWTASFQIVEQVLPSNLSAKSGSDPASVNEPPPPEADFDDVVIRVRWNGEAPSFEVNETQVASLDEVRQRLRALATIKQDAPIFVLPDEAAPMLHVIDVYDAARMESFQKVSLAARSGR